MDSFLVYCSICCCLVLSIDGVTLTLEMKSILPLKGSRLELTCRISEPFNSNSIVVWKEASQVTLCYADNYRCDFYKNGYSFTTNNTGAFGSISSLTTEAEGAWRCSYRRSSGGDTFSNTWNVIVYTIPPGLSITQDPNQDVDLSVDSVELQCKTTGCTYPMPTVHWSFQDQTTSSENNYTIDNPTGKQEMCVTQEKIYTSTLNLPLYTTLNDNSDKTVTFSCRIDYPDSSRKIIAYASNTVRFAVRVTDVMLQQDNQNITETLIVTSAEPVTLACVTGKSRPTPTIGWYIGSQKKGDRPSVTFTFTNMDHNETIYCQAYNTDPSRPVSSAKPRLFVQVRVTEAVLKQNNQNITETLNVTAAELGNLTCATGNSRPTPTIDWYIGSRKIASGVSLTYIFSNMDHNEMIFCQAYNTDPGRPVSSAKPRLFVQVSVTNVTIASGNVTVVFYEGVSQSLSCTSSPSRPVPTIRWWLGNSQVTDNITVLDTTDANTLHVLTSNVTLVMMRNRTNQTIYCDGFISSQVHPATSKQLIVAVWYAPDVKVNISGFAVVNSTAVLMCIAQGEPQKFTFHQWTHMVGQTKIRTIAGENTFNFSNLTLSNISIQDMGTYICTVDNSITGLDGQINRMADTHVKVEGVPFVGKTQSTFAGETNKSASIEIQFYSYPSIMTVKFIKQLASSEISNTSDISIYIQASNITMMFYNKKVTIPGHLARLHFSYLKDMDFGNYTLQLSNGQGSMSWPFELIVSAPPSVPKKFFFSHIDDGFLVFGIEAGFNGGHIQTFIIEYQPLGLPEATWSTVLKINETGLDDPFSNGTYNIKIPKIQDGQYIFRVYAENEKGNSSALESEHVEIKTELPSAVIEDVLVGAVVGGVVGAFVLVIVIVAVAFIIKRRKLKPIMGELVDNPVYDASNSRSGIAVVTHAEDPSNLYAQVDKTKTNKEKAAAKGKHGKTSRAASKGKHGKMSRGDIYENTTQAVKSSAENVYENPGQLATGPSSGDKVYETPEASASKSKMVNKEGLLYADVILGPPTKKAGKPVIHGLEDRTEYADIAFGKRGEPLPETDEVKENGGAKKKNGTKSSTDE